MTKRPPTPLPPDGPLGVSEAAKYLGVPVGTVKTWRARGQFPEPDWELTITPLWKRQTVRNWHRRWKRSHP